MPNQSNSTTRTAETEVSGSLAALLAQSSPAIVQEALERTGDPILQRAARAIAWPSGGRPPADDRAALEEARWQVENGFARSMHAAFLRLAKSLGRRNPKAYAERLRRKAKRQK